MSKITFMYTKPQTERLTVDGDERCVTNIKKFIEKMSELTGASPTKIKRLVNKYDKERNKHYDFRTERDLKEYIFEAIHKRKEGDNICDNLE